MLLRILLCCLAVLLMVGCNGSHSKTRTVTILARDYSTDAVVAVFTITQKTGHGHSRIYLNARNVSSETLSFTFTLNIDGYPDYIDFTNSVVELPPNQIQNFGEISTSHLNIYDASIYFSTPIFPVYFPTANG